MDRLTRGALGAWLGAAALAGHGVVVVRHAVDGLRLPAERGGLFLGPFVALPALVVGLLLLAAAVLVVTGPRGRPAVALAVLACWDALFVLGGGGGWLLLGAACAAASLGLLASAYRAPSRTGL